MKIEEYYEQHSIPLWSKILSVLSCAIVLICPFFGTAGTSNIFAVFGISAMLVALVILLILTSKLHTLINRNGIHVKMSPFMRKFKLYAWNEIAEYKIEKYNPILDTGGFGLKIRLNIFRNRGRMTVYNLSGNIALKLNLNNGRKVWIGTANGIEMQRFLENLNTESGKRRGK